MSRKFAVWELGFRPLFLMSLLAASMFMAAWLWLLDRGPSSTSYFDPTLWHAHEMIYGFAVAVVVGFILTASQSWTNIPGVKGSRLVLLCAVWLLARLLLVLPIAPRMVTGAMDLSFLLLAVIFLAPYLGRSKQKRNAVFLVLMGLLIVGNALMHLGPLGILPGYERRGAYLGLHVIILMIVVIGGRVIPMFSQGAVEGYSRPSATWIDAAAPASVAAFGIASFVAPMSLVTGICAAIAAVVNLRRWLSWTDRRVWRVPILAVLYVGYAWIIIGLALTALTDLSLVNVASTHAFTVGAVGTMIIGMISRVSLGHTGRPIVASRGTVGAYACVTAAALIRVFGPVLTPESYMVTVQVAGLFWIAAFVLTLASYARVLLSARVDGRSG